MCATPSCLPTSRNGQAGPCQGELRIKPDRLGIKVSDPLCRIEVARVIDRDRAQVNVIRFRIFSGLLRNCLLLGAGELGVELVGNGAGHLAFHSKDIVEFAIIAFRPEMLVRGSANQLNIYFYGVGDLLHAAFEDVRHAQLFANFAQVFRLALVFHGGRARNHLERGDLRQPGKDFVLDSFREVGVGFVVAQVLKWKHGNTLFLYRRG